MIIEKKRFSSEKGKQIFNINGIDFDINIDEFKDFLAHCALFMDITKEGFDTMIGSISDSIIDNENQNITMEEVRPQLKFLREISFYLKSIYQNESIG
ncbi:hypothetical protein [Mucilaginibacter sp. FT3.2]|uniref:hypothetical protein n=1 Tax=Mucilaginibacter sp. FT3.2 TaxID=2723090 RepID=UPI00160F7F78|nr:hypothetical protein [Mucilaginibacter sp. FT3.2]MBB6234585.1 hypothetical protein [Mucilaginibacter sp. FT3.2]